MTKHLSIDSTNILDASAEVLDNGYIKTIEGNTNARGGREGYTVAEKKRKIDFKKNHGLRMLGFIKPN